MEGKKREPWQFTNEYLSLDEMSVSQIAGCLDRVGNIYIYCGFSHMAEPLREHSLRLRDIHRRLTGKKTHVRNPTHSPHTALSVNINPYTWGAAATWLTRAGLPEARLVTEDGVRLNEMIQRRQYTRQENGSYNVSVTAATEALISCNRRVAS